MSSDERRRAQDCYERIRQHSDETAGCFQDLSGRLGHVEDKIDVIEEKLEDVSVKVEQARNDGCIFRDEETRRILKLESKTDALQETIQSFKETVAEFKVEIVKEIAGIRVWVLVGVLAILVACLGFLIREYVFPDIRHELSLPK
jgi:archaellum component FlaC